MRPLNERSTRRLVLTRADMPQSVQDLHEVASDDEGEGHDESVPVFDPDEDDDTDSVIDALQHDWEGDVIPADSFIDSLGSDFVNRFNRLSMVDLNDVWFLLTVHQFWMRVVTSGSCPPTRFDMTAGDTDQEDVRSEGGRPGRLMFPLSSREIVKVLWMMRTATGRLKPGLRSVCGRCHTSCNKTTFSGHQECSGVPRRGRFANTVFPASEFDEKHSQIFGETVQECHEAALVEGGSAGNQCCWKGVESCSSSSRGCSFIDLP